jgi:hypothetical protein
MPTFSQAITNFSGFIVMLSLPERVNSGTACTLPPGAGITNTDGNVCAPNVFINA